MAKLHYAFIAFLLVLPLYLCNAHPPHRSHESALRYPPNGLQRPSPFSPGRGQRPRYTPPGPHGHLLSPPPRTPPRSHESRLGHPPSKLHERLPPVSPGHYDIAGPHAPPSHFSPPGHHHGPAARPHLPLSPNPHSGPSVSFELGSGGLGRRFTVAL
ncbi:hypothetical protein D918_06364 [Trichuris suis]|nr:hypothetical protein D918_06364 [Trichuris suis]